MLGWFQLAATEYEPARSTRPFTLPDLDELVRLLTENYEQLDSDRGVLVLL
jgi:hypothetical protein